MKEKKKSGIVMIVILAILLLAGIIVKLTIGFQYDLMEQEHTRIDFYIGKQFELAEIRKITSEVLGDKKVVLRKVEAFEDMVAISVKEVSEEEIKAIMEKVNETYELDYKYEEINVVKEPGLKNIDRIKPYILPMAIATVIIFVYFAIRYYPLGSIKVLVRTMVSLLLGEALLVSVIAITRMPINRFTIPAAILVYLVILIYLVFGYEKIRKNIYQEKEK